MKKCPFCAEEIQNEAIVCKHCGRDLVDGPKKPTDPKKKGHGCLWLLGLVGGFILLVIIASVTSKNTKTPTNQPAQAPESKQEEVAKPPLQLNHWTWAREYGFATATGEVKNISDEKLENVEAVFSTYDKNGNFINSGEALIEYNPILPGQTSPFKAMMTWNPAMVKAGIEFKTMLGGRLEYVEKGKEKKK